MDPILLGRGRLRTTAPRRRPGVAAAAFAGLLLIASITGVLSARDQGGAAAVVPAQLTSGPGLALIPGTKVPEPPPSFGLRMSVGRRGVTVFRSPTPITAVGARELFSFYLDSMSTQGWTLLGKGDPTRAGWTLRWQFRQQAVLLALTTAPTQRLEVDLCPPRPYC